jgi:hypothetical protein
MSQGSQNGTAPVFNVVQSVRPVDTCQTTAKAGRFGIEWNQVKFQIADTAP